MNLAIQTNRILVDTFMFTYLQGVASEYSLTNEDLPTKGLLQKVEILFPRKTGADVSFTMSLIVEEQLFTIVVEIEVGEETRKYYDNTKSLEHLKGLLETTKTVLDTTLNLTEVNKTFVSPNLWLGLAIANTVYTEGNERYLLDMCWYNGKHVVTVVDLQGDRSNLIVHEISTTQNGLTISSQKGVEPEPKQTSFETLSYGYTDYVTSLYKIILGGL